MTPQMMTSFLEFLFNRRSSKGRRKQGFFARTAYGLGGIMASIMAFTAYLGIPPETVQAWLGNKATVVLEKVEQKVGERIEIPGRSNAANGAIRCFFTTPPSEPGDRRDAAHACKGFIDAAKTSLDVAGFEINNRVILEAIVQAHRRGVRVRVVTDTDYNDEEGPTAFRAAGIPVVDDKRSALMHNKFIVRDNTAVWTGSMNLTENCAYRNNNNGVILEVPAIAENYTTKFRWMFEEKVFGRRPTRDARIPNPVVTLPDGSVIETYFATHDECADRLTKLIREARTSIDFLAFSFTHRAMGTAMLERSRAGVKVRGVFEKSQSTNAFTQFHALQKAGLPVFVDANPRNMHHKVMLLDRSITVTGSFNFSDSADKTNDENLVFIRNAPAVAEAFAAEIERVYGAAMTAAKN